MINQIFNAIYRRVTHKAKTIEDVISTEVFIKTKLDGLVDLIRLNIASMNEYHAILKELFNQ